MNKSNKNKSNNNKGNNKTRNQWKRNSDEQIRSLQLQLERAIKAQARALSKNQTGDPDPHLHRVWEEEGELPVDDYNEPTRAAVLLRQARGNADPFKNRVWGEERPVDDYSGPTGDLADFRGRIWNGGVRSQKKKIKNQKNKNNKKSSQKNKKNTPQKKTRFKHGRPINDRNGGGKRK